MARSSSDSTSAIPPFRGSGPGGTLTEVDARKLLDEHARSGLSLNAFAASRGLSGERLGWWRCRFRRAEASPAPRAVPEVSFVPVTLAPTDVAPTRSSAASDASPSAPTRVATPYELVLGGAATLRIPADFHDASLVRLVRVLTEAL